MTLATLSVLAGAYRGRQETRTTATHAIDLEGGQRTLCTRVSADRMADEYSATDAEKAAPPTCRVCLRRDPRHKTPTANP